jgi:uncharacterized protein YndB with AHSA1/START domain
MGKPANTDREPRPRCHGLLRLLRELDSARPPIANPLSLLQWVGPDSLDSNRVDRWDCRTGGEWRYVSIRDNEEQWFRGCFHEVRPNEVIVQTFCYEPMADSVSLGRLVLEDLPGGSCRLTATSLVDSFEARDAFVASGMDVGVQEGYRKLDTLLAQ